MCIHVVMLGHNINSMTHNITMEGWELSLNLSLVG